MATAKQKRSKLISQKIGHLMRNENKPQDQAVAMAYNMVDNSKYKNKHRSKKGY